LCAVREKNRLENESLLTASLLTEELSQDADLDIPVMKQAKGEYASQQ
jgi:hypothetical protein